MRLQRIHAVVLTCLVTVLSSNLAIAATKSLAESALDDKRTLARAMFGSFGWLVLGIASIITVIDYFHDRNMQIIYRLAFTFITVWVLSRWLAT